MELIGDYHTHTIYSSKKKPSTRHAKATIRENVEAAFAKGLKEIAITDHGPGHYLYGIREEYIPLMRKEIDKLNEEFQPKGLKVLLGIEANIVSLDGTLDVDENIIKQIDILLMGYHYGAKPKKIIDGMALYLLNFFSKVFYIGKNRAKKFNTQAYINAIRKYPIDLITHPGSKAPIDIVEVAKEASKFDTALEISSKHSELSVENIKKLLDIDVSYMVNSDAHDSKDIGDVENAIRKAKEANLPLDRIKNIKKKED